VTATRRYRAGESLEDYCRACKNDRLHTVIAADSDGRPLRVSCGYCRSEHGYRGGPRIEASGALPPGTIKVPGTVPAAPVSATRRSSAPVREGFPIISERERTMPEMSAASTTADLELLLRRIIREEAGVSIVPPADKWRGGALVLRPGTAGLQEKSIPIETFFHKIVMLRNRLRTLEQHVNAAELPDDVKVKLQAYITGCYGSLTSFNVLFAEDEDQFKGSGGE
jgi:hypothetical protein